MSCDRLITDADADAIVAAAHPDAEFTELIGFVSELRFVSAGPAPAPSPALAQILAHGISDHPVESPVTATNVNGAALTAQDSETQKRRTRMPSRYSLAGKVLLVAGAATAAAGGVAAAGSLPDSAQNAVAAAVRAVTPFEIPDPDDDIPEVVTVDLGHVGDDDADDIDDDSNDAEGMTGGRHGDKADDGDADDTNEHAEDTDDDADTDDTESFGDRVSEDARGGDGTRGVDGQQISTEAKNKQHLDDDTNEHAEDTDVDGDTDDIESFGDRVSEDARGGDGTRGVDGQQISTEAKNKQHLDDDTDEAATSDEADEADEGAKRASAGKPVDAGAPGAGAPAQPGVNGLDQANETPAAGKVITEIPANAGPLTAPGAHRPESAPPVSPAPDEPPAGATPPSDTPVASPPAHTPQGGSHNHQSGDSGAGAHAKSGHGKP